MSNLGDILGWTFDNASGIETRNDRITAWPAGLGNEPTLQEIANYRSNYLAYLEDVKSVRQQIRAIILNSVGVDITELTTNQLRAFLVVLLFERGAVSSTGKIKHPDSWFTDS